MAKESEIVGYINTALSSGQFQASKFSKGSFNNIGELVKINEQGEFIPCIVDINGETTKLSIDDVKPFQLYHRVLSASFNADESDDFGDYAVRKQTMNMTMVIIADRERLQVTKEQLITAVSLGFPLELTATQKTALNIQQCNIIPNDFITDYNDVYSREYNISDYLLKPQTIMIALNYDLETESFESCVEICAS